MSSHYLHKPGEGHGNIFHWNATPTRNLGNSKEIFLVGANNPANILTTIWSNRQKKFFEQNFTIVETQYEQLARQMLLLAISLDQNYLTYKEKVFCYLEIYGNSFIRSSVQIVLDNFINDLIEALTDPDYCKKRFANFDFHSQLKQRDVDLGCLKFT